MPVQPDRVEYGVGCGPDSCAAPGGRRALPDRVHPGVSAYRLNVDFDPRPHPLLSHNYTSADQNEQYHAQRRQLHDKLSSELSRRVASPRVVATRRFLASYENRTARPYVHFLGRHGPRNPPRQFMWPADRVGDVHEVVSPNGHW